jgi:hypothetical protein
LNIIRSKEEVTICTEMDNLVDEIGDLMLEETASIIEQK